MVEAPSENPLVVVESPVAVVFATRTQLLQAVTSLPEQLVQKGYHNSAFQGHIGFTPKPSKYVIPNLEAEYSFPYGPEDENNPAVSVAILNQEEMDDDQRRQTSDSLLTGGKPAKVIAILSFKPAVIERFRTDFFPGLLARGYRPEYACFSGLGARDWGIEAVTLTRRGALNYQDILTEFYPGFDPDEIPTLIFGRSGHADRWVERVIQEFGAEEDYEDYSP